MRACAAENSRALGERARAYGSEYVPVISDRSDVSGSADAAAAVAADDDGSAAAVAVGDANDEAAAADEAARASVFIDSTRPTSFIAQAETRCMRRQSQTDGRIYTHTHRYTNTDIQTKTDHKDRQTERPHVYLSHSSYSVRLKDKDGRTDRQTDRRTDRRTDRQTVRRCVDSQTMQDGTDPVYVL